VFSREIAIDVLVRQRSPLHRWEIRCKLLALVPLVFAFAAITELRLVPVIGAIALGCYVLAQLPWRFWWRRVRYPGLFMLALVAALPWLSGTDPLVTLPLTDTLSLTLYREGSAAALLIAGRFLAILTVVLVLFATSSLVNLTRGLRSLGLSPILTDLVLLSYRYLVDVGRDWQQMRTAMRLRGFQLKRPNRRQLNTLAAAVGTLTIRSYEQSQRVYHAMRLRGYGTGPGPSWRDRDQPWRWFSGDAIALYGVWLGAIGLLVVQGLLRNLS
jgi:cobalt/nickel transport system permease protein